MGLLGTIRSRLATLLTPARSAGGWWPVVGEPYTGAWQKNDALAAESLLSNPSVFGCITRIAADISKIAPPLLVERDDDNVWTETTNPAYSPVLRRPNRYQTAQLFTEQWVLSKLWHGNTYVLKDRDERGVVNAQYVLDPLRVKPLIAPDGSVYYELQVNELAGLTGPLVVPAREVIHDRWNCLFHPLVGISPLYACSGAAHQGLKMQDASTAFFSSGGRPGGMLIAPTEIDPLTAQRLSETWHNLGPGKTAVVGNNMKYEAIGSSAVDSQLTDQLSWTEEEIAKCFGMPISILNSSKQPPYANSEASQLQYKSQCLEPHFTSIATLLDDGLELPSHLWIQFDFDRLIEMDTATKTKAAHDAIFAGVMTLNEARYKYFGLGPVTGGNTPYLQQQMTSVAALAERDAHPPSAAPALAPPATPPADEPTEEDVAATVGELAES